MKTEIKHLLNKNKNKKNLYGINTVICIEKDKYKPREIEIHEDKQNTVEHNVLKCIHLIMFHI